WLNWSFCSAATQSPNPAASAIIANGVGSAAGWSKRDQMPRQIRLNAFDMNCVGHQSPGLWTHPRDRADRYNTLEYWGELGKLLERALYRDEAAENVKLQRVMGVGRCADLDRRISIGEAVEPRGSHQHRRHGDGGVDLLVPVVDEDRK